MRDAPVGQQAAPLRLLDRREPSFRGGDFVPMTFWERWMVRRALRLTKRSAECATKAQAAMMVASIQARARLGDDAKLAADTRTNPWKWIIDR